MGDFGGLGNIRDRAEFSGDELLGSRVTKLTESSEIRIFGCEVFEDLDLGGSGFIFRVMKWFWILGFLALSGCEAEKNEKKETGGLSGRILREEGVGSQKKEEDIRLFLTEHGIDPSLPMEERLKVMQSRIDEPWIQKAQRIRLGSANEKGGDDEDLILIRWVAGLELPENQVTTFYHQYGESINQLNGLRAQGLGEQHPEVVFIRKKAESSLAGAKESASEVEMRSRGQL